MPHRPVKSILGLTGAALWLVSGCAATTAPSFEPLISGEHATRDHAWHHQAGVGHLKAARYGLAVFELRKALREDPRSVETLNAVAIAYDHLGRFEVSRRYYDRALALDPGAIQTLNNLGRSAALQGDTAAALAWLERAHQQGPGAPEVVENLADARKQAAPALASNQPPLSATRGDPPTRPPMHQPIRAWVERTDRLHQTLVTTAPLEFVQTLAYLDLRPELVNVAGERAPALPNRAIRRDDGAPDGATAPADTPQLAAGAPPEATDEAPSATTSARLELSNGAGRRGMAARMRTHLSQQGVAVARLTNAGHFGHTTSAIFYRPGFADSAAAFSQALPVRVDLIEDDGQSSDVRLRLGGDLLDFDLRLLNKS